MWPKKSEGLILRGWLVDRGLDSATFDPEVWQILRANLAVLKDIAGLTNDEIARRVYGGSNGEPMSSSRCVLISRALNESYKIEQLETIARACGFDPLLLVVPNLRERVSALANSLTSEIKFETSIFRAMRKCENCHHLNRDLNACYCSRCGMKITLEKE